MPSVVTANVLRSGAVVYLGARQRWVPSLADAAVASNPAELAALEKTALSAVVKNEITAVYAMDVRLVAGKPTPASVRERIRAERAVSA